MTLLFLLGGLLAIAYITTGVSILREQWDQDALSSQIDMAEGALIAAEDAREELEDLEARLSAAKQELVLAESVYPNELDSSAVLETILAYADESQARVLKVDSRPPATLPDETSAYSVLGLNLELEGDFSQLVAFLSALDGRSSLTASRIGDFSLEEEGGWFLLNLEVLTYARSPVDEISAPEAPESPSGQAMETVGDGQGTRND